MTEKLTEKLHKFINTHQKMISYLNQIIFGSKLSQIDYYSVLMEISKVEFYNCEQELTQKRG